MDRRAQSMYAAYLDGATLEEVGQQFGLTRERIRQIFVKAGLPTRSIRQAFGIKRKAELKRAQEIVRLFKEVGDELQVSTTLGISVHTVREALSTHLPTARVYRKHNRTGSHLKYSDDDLLVVLRLASIELGGVITTHSYSRLAQNRRLPNGLPWPTHQTHLKRFGSWRAALAKAGLASNPPSPIAGQLLFGVEHCIDALREAARFLARVPTVDAYEDFARGLKGAVPSSATIRNRCGSWSGALRLAFADLDPEVSLPSSYLKGT